MRQDDGTTRATQAPATQSRRTILAKCCNTKSGDDEAQSVMSRRDPAARCPGVGQEQSIGGGVPSWKVRHGGCTKG